VRYLLICFAILFSFIPQLNAAHWEWTSHSPTGLNLEDVWHSGTDMFAVGDYGAIVRYNGTSFEVMDSRTITNLTGVWGSAASNIYAVGGQGTVLHYDGSSWKKMDSDTQNNLQAVWGSDADHIWAVGSSGTILY